MEASIFLVKNISGKRLKVNIYAYMDKKETMASYIPELACKSSFQYTIRLINLTVFLRFEIKAIFILFEGLHVFVDPLL